MPWLLLFFSMKQEECSWKVPCVMIISESATFYIINMLSFDEGFSHRTIENGTFNDFTAEKNVSVQGT